MWNFSNKLIHATDTTNASTTMLFNINTLEWDSELLDLFDIPRSASALMSGPRVRFTATWQETCLRASRSR